MLGGPWRRFSKERRQVGLGLCAGLLAARSGATSMTRYELRALVQVDSAGARQVLDALTSRYAGLAYGADPRALAQRPGHGVYLAIGPAALQAALDAELRGPVMGLFTSRQAFQRIVAASAGGRARTVSAIFAEASPAAQFELIAAIFQRRVTVGVLLSEVTAPLEPLLNRAARRFDLELATRRLTAGANIVQELAALAAANVLLALPDSNVFTSENLRVVLESTYRRGKPVIGFSPALVNAGTLAAAYASIDDMLDHLDVLLAELDTGQFPEPQYPLYWRVAVNESVARSLDVVITDDVRNLGNKARRK